MTDKKLKKIQRQFDEGAYEERHGKPRQQGEKEAYKSSGSKARAKKNVDADITDAGDAKRDELQEPMKAARDYYRALMAGKPRSEGR
jgi:hypothetical protein